MQEISDLKAQMECTSDGQIIRARELDTTNFIIPKKVNVRENVATEQTSILLNEIYTEPVPPPPPCISGTINDVNGINVLKRMREEPKIHKPSNGQRWNLYGDVNDETLPKELREQFQPLYCKLCLAQLGSTVNAKLHYLSKNHNKKVRKFLEEYAEQTGTPLHKRAKIPAKPKSDEEYNPKHFHCEVCDLPLTGKIHAESHYMGKNHQKVVSGKKVPGKGFYTEEGKFVRMLAPTPDPTGGDGFGLDFTQPKSDQPEKATTLRCDLCQVSVTSFPQMDMHLVGQKHQKKIRAAGLPPTPNATPAEPIPKASVYASYRTPSGQFYCKACNLSLNSESQFGTHLQSKNHAKKSSKSD